MIVLKLISVACAAINRVLEVEDHVLAVIHTRSRSRKHDARSRNYRLHSSPSAKRRDHNKTLCEQMHQILDRLTSLEERQCPPVRQPGDVAYPQTPSVPPENVTANVAEHRNHAVLSSPACSVSAATSRDAVATDRIVDAIRSINHTVRSNQSFYISNFDPNLNDIDNWCEEVRSRFKSVERQRVSVTHR